MGKKNQATQKQEIAARVREVRQKVGMTQEQFSEKLELSLSAYKKIESAENQISLDSLRKLEENFNVSLDYILVGKKSDADEVWKNLLNCSEKDKMVSMLRLWNYFGKLQEGKYPTNEEQLEADEIVLQVIKEIDL